MEPWQLFKSAPTLPKHTRFDMTLKHNISDALVAGNILQHLQKSHGKRNFGPDYYQTVEHHRTKTDSKWLWRFKTTFVFLSISSNSQSSKFLISTANVVSHNLPSSKSFVCSLWSITSFHAIEIGDTQPIYRNADEIDARENYPPSNQNPNIFRPLVKAASPLPTSALNVTGIKHSISHMSLTSKHSHSNQSLNITHVSFNQQHSSKSLVISITQHHSPSCYLHNNVSYQHWTINRSVKSVGRKTRRNAKSGWKR